MTAATSNRTIVDIVVEEIKKINNVPSIADFRWNSSLPLYDVRFVYACMASYLFCVFLAQFIMKYLKPAEMRVATIIHNYILCFWSLWMFVGMAYYTIERVMTSPHGWKTVFCTCSDDDKAGGVWFYSWMFLVSKVYEYVDTFIQIARKKPLKVLHVWHHLTVGYMAWLWLDSYSSVGFTGVLFNTGIHIIMYYYYATCALLKDQGGYNPWWKKYLTQLQIIQFICSYVFTILYFYLYNSAENQCVDKPYAKIVTAAITFSYLILFINFYITSYNESRERKALKNQKNE